MKRRRSSDVKSSTFRPRIARERPAAFSRSVARNVGANCRCRADVASSAVSENKLSCSRSKSEFVQAGDDATAAL
jgi:hypothetical protein